MKVPLKLSIVLVSALLSTNSYAFPELPFCPGGGPPGWMNHFNYKRDQNIWRHYSQYRNPAYSRAVNQPVYNAPLNYTPNNYAPAYSRPVNRYEHPPAYYNPGIYYQGQHR